VKSSISSKDKWRKEVVTSFVEKRTRNSFMNCYLSDPKRSYSEVCKKKQESMNRLREEVPKEEFFYHQFNQTIVRSQKGQRFSMSRGKCKTESSQGGQGREVKEARQGPNLFAMRNENRQRVPHGVQDIVDLVRLKSNFQKCFRRGKKVKYLFKFDDQAVPLYIKSRFNRLS
jgi:hypothetical protein